jgi:hypothetical protein
MAKKAFSFVCQIAIEAIAERRTFNRFSKP